MNLKRFTARTSRDALALVREALGDDAVVLSTKPCADGVEVLAMAPEGMVHIERMSAPAAALPAASAAPAAAPAAARAAPGAVPVARVEPRLDATTAVADDVAKLSMSTLSFQDYVRERMLKRRQAAIEVTRRTLEPAIAVPAAPVPPTPARVVAPAAAPAVARAELREGPVLREEMASSPLPARPPESPWRASPTLADAAPARSRSDQQDMLDELRSVKGLIDERFGALAFMEKLQRQPVQARLTQRLLDAGFSPALIRKISAGLPADVSDDAGWVAAVLERNLHAGETEGALEDQGGVHALIGATGVGKTTSTAKIAAAFATRHGAAHLGLITLDAYRVAAHEQLRAYGRILGVPVHTAHDRSSLEDLLDLLSAKKMVLIDTAGMAQRDARTRELLDMLSHRSIQRVLVINAAAQGETIEDVMLAYRASTCKGVVLSKMDEAVKLGPALDAVIRHRQKVLGVATGQRVPEDWHRLSGHALVQRALRATAGTAYRLDAAEVSLVFSGPHHAAAQHGTAAAASHAA